MHHSILYLYTLLVDVMVSMAPQVVVKVVSQMILMEVAQIFPLPLNLEVGIDMIDIVRNISNLNKV